MTHSVSTTAPEKAAGEQWDAQQIAFWDKVAPSYDQIYKSEWNRLEDAHVQKQLGWVAQVPGCRVLDLGCGTGLGYEMCRAINESVQYTGMDISAGMIEQCRQRWPELAFDVGGMADLSRYPDNSFDAVISLYSAFSHSQAVAATVAEMYRVVRPGQRILIAALNRWTLYRVLSLQWGPTMAIHADQKEMSAPARLYGRRELKGIFEAAGFTDVQVAGFGVLGYILEHHAIWPLDLRLARFAPGLGYTLLVQGKKPGDGYGI
jgi:ubiquinone/menaquinone biosynthesis C-methylase UbiE